LLVNAIYCSAYCRTFAEPESPTKQDTTPSEIKHFWQLYQEGDTFSGAKIMAEKVTAGDKEPNTAYWCELYALSGPILLYPKKSVSFAAMAAALAPKNPHILSTYALTLARANRAQEGLEQVSFALALDPTNARAHAVAARCYLILENGAKANNEMAQALKLAPGDFEINSLGGAFYLEQGVVDKAKACFDSLVAAEPKSVQAYYLRAEFKAKTGDLKGAILDYEKGIALSPRSYLLWHERGMNLQAIGRFSDAITSFTKCIEIDPSRTSYERRAMCFEAMRDYKHAIADYSTALRKSGLKDDRIYEPKQIKEGTLKNLRENWTRRMGLYIKVGDFQSAIHDSTQLVERTPQDADIALSMRQEALRKSGKYGEALQDLKFLIKIDPEVAQWHKLRAEVYEKLGDKKAAALDLEQATRLDKTAF
jgi:tetratricopeptide (TPR) repeat protein